MIQIDLMIFDIDGTLIDSRKDIVGAVNFTLRKLGIEEKSFDEIVSCIGTGVRDLLRKSLGGNNIDLLDESVSIFGEYYKRHSTDHTKPYPHTVEMLEYFKDKKKIIVTNRNREFAKLTLDPLGLGKYFEEIIGGDDEHCVKPMACPLDNVILGFKMDKKKTIMIGDMDLDVFAGRAAGVYTCAVTYGIGRKEDIIAAKPDFIIDNIMELKDVIQ